MGEKATDVDYKVSQLEEKHIDTWNVRKKVWGILQYIKSHEVVSEKSLKAKESNGRTKWPG
jgi:hypothetical protein